MSFAVVSAVTAAVGTFATGGLLVGAGASLAGGALIGAIAGGVVAAVDGRPIGKGMLKGALLGTAVAGVAGLSAAGAAGATKGSLAGAKGLTAVGATQAGEAATAASMLGQGSVGVLAPTAASMTPTVAPAVPSIAAPVAAGKSFMDTQMGAASVIAGGQALAGLMSESPTEVEKLRIADAQAARTVAPMTKQASELGVAPKADATIARSQVQPSIYSQEFIEATKEAYKQKGNVA